MFFNPLYLLLIVPALLGWYAQERVRKIYEKQGAQPNSLGVSGLEVAKYLLSHYGLAHVAIERAEGHLTDHYDPQSKRLRLSDGVANGRSVTALGIVAHEVGHAVQDAEGYRFVQVRTSLARRVSQVTQWSSFIFVGGMLFGIPILMGLGGVMLAGLTLLALVTLPVERNASDRALASLKQMGLADAEEVQGVRHVLRAASFTYLAALGQRLATFLFFVVAVAAARGLWQR
jgi:Zn-dependent membrane protease YugP